MHESVRVVNYRGSLRGPALEEDTNLDVWIANEIMDKISHQLLRGAVGSKVNKRPEGNGDVQVSRAEDEELAGAGVVHAEAEMTVADVRQVVLVCVGVPVRVDGVSIVGVQVEGVRDQLVPQTGRGEGIWTIGE